MLKAKWMVRSLVGVFLLGAALSQQALAQYPCNASYGGGYGYQSQSYYGQPGLLPFQGGYQGSSFFAPNSYAQFPTLGGGQGLPLSAPVPTQSFYSGSVNYGHSHQSHHHGWHPGHYLLGHY